MPGMALTNLVTNLPTVFTLYRVIMRNSNGEQINHRATSADRGFKKDFGKLYILR